MRRIRVVVVVAAVWCAVAGVGARGQGAAGPRANPARATIAESIGTIEKNDLLRITVDDLIATGAQDAIRARVDDEGNVRVPVVGARKVEGLTTAAAEKEIAKAFHDAGAIQGANVGVVRLEVGSRAGAKVGKLEAGDLVVVAIAELTGPGVVSEFRARVGADGALPLPLIGAVDVGGGSEGAAVDAIVKGYRDAHLIQTPMVWLTRDDERPAVKAGPIAKGDVLEFVIYDLVGPMLPLEKKVRVDGEGRGAFPLVGPVKVEGLSEAKALEAVNKAYSAAHLVKHPITSLWRSQSADGAGGEGGAGVKPGPIGAGDLLRVGVYELGGPGVETVRTLKVDGHGFVSPPMVKPVKVGGLTDGGAEAAIAKAYKEAGVIRHAVVSVLKVDGAAALPEEEVRDRQPPRPAGKKG